MIGFWHRLRTGSNSKISSILFNFSKRLFDGNSFQSKWLHKINSLLNNLGAAFLWNFEGISHKQLKSFVKRRLKDQFLQNWESEMRTNKLCTNYVLIKENFGQEPYLNILNKDLRIILSKYRSGSHLLPISDQRYNPIDDRNNCPLCRSDCGDEYHYIMNCPAFDHIRTNYIDQNYISRPNVLKFKSLFSSTNISTLTKLSKFIKIIMFTFRP